MSLGEYAGAKRDVGAESGSGAATETRMAKVAASAVADQRQKDRSDRVQLMESGELCTIVGGDLSVRSGGGSAGAAILHAAPRTHIVATGFQNCVVCCLTGLACRRSLLRTSALSSVSDAAVRQSTAIRGWPLDGHSTSYICQRVI